MSSAGSIRRSSLGTLLPGFVGTELPSWLATRLRDGLAGVCLFGENVVSRPQLRALTDAIRAANPAAIIAIDEEGGDVTRLYAHDGSPYPGNALLGRINDRELTAEVGAAVARELRSVGVNLNFAPDADINSNPDNPVIGVRSFGDDPGLVAAHTLAWIQAHEAQGVAVSAKHFPGHGDTAQDSHHALPTIGVNAAVLRERELRPFVAAVQAGARTIMTSHIVVTALDPSTPATFSSAILGDLLRDELGFEGVIVSDALDMAGASAEIGIPAAAVRALAAGVDLLCIGTRNTDEQLGEIVAALDAAIADGSLPGDRLADALGRVAALATSLPAPLPIDSAPHPSFDLERAIDAFIIRDGLIVAPNARIVTLETVANMAVGASPWGPAAAGAETTPVFEGDDIFGIDGQLILVGKDIHRHPWTRQFVDGVRETRPTAIVVDMGWPSLDRAYADVATFGASRFVGEALVTWLEREAQ